MHTHLATRSTGLNTFSSNLKMSRFRRKTKNSALVGMIQSMVGSVASGLELPQDGLYCDSFRRSSYAFERNFLKLTLLHASLYVDNSADC